MYINLLLGGVALAVVVLLLKKLLVREDSLSERPAYLLQQEIEKRRIAEKNPAGKQNVLPGGSAVRMRPVAEALAEIHAAMKGAAKQHLSWVDDGDTITVRMAGSFCEPYEGDRSPDKDDSIRFSEEEFDVTLTVVWLPSDNTFGGKGVFGGGGGYMLRYSDGRAERSAGTLEACVRDIASFIVDFIK